MANPTTEQFLNNLQLCRAIFHQALVVVEPLMIMDLLAIVNALQQHHMVIVDIIHPGLMAILDNLQSNTDILEPTY